MRNKQITIKYVSCVVLTLLLMGVSVSNATLYTGSLSSPAGSGLESGGISWDTSVTGFRVTWEVSENVDSTWHYKYTFQDESGGTLSMLVSHMIISLSDNIDEDDLFNYGSDIQLVDEDGENAIEFGTFGVHPSNPGFPLNETITGVKLNMDEEGAQLVAEFDSNRMPMWGDFYAKDGGDPKNYAYNTSFGIEVANLHDYAGTPEDAYGNILHKILVPNTIPEPATLAILALGGLTLLRRTR